MLKTVETRGSISHVQCDCGRKFWESTSRLAKKTACKICTKRARVRTVNYDGRIMTIAEFWRRYVPRYAGVTVANKVAAGLTPEQIVDDYRKFSPHRPSVRYEGKWYSVREFSREFVEPRLSYASVVRRLKRRQSPDYIVKISNMPQVTYGGKTYTIRGFSRVASMAIDVVEQQLCEGLTPAQIVESSQQQRG